MPRNISRRAGSLSIAAVGSSLAVSARETGDLGLLVGAAVVVLVTLATADGVFWLFALWALLRKRPAKEATHSPDEVAHENAAWRQALVELARARAGLPADRTSAIRPSPVRRGRNGQRTG